MRGRYNRLVQSLLGLLAVTALIVMPAPQPAEAGDVGAVVDLVLIPPSQTVATGETFDVTIQAQCNGQDVDEISAVIKFNPEHVEVQSVIPGTTVPTVLQNTYDNAVGRIDYQADKSEAPFPADTFTVASISFKAMNSTDRGRIRFQTRGNRRTDAEFGGESKLRDAIGATVIILAVNSAPVLSDGQVSPDTGYVATSFTYLATYTDANNDPPSSVTVSIDGGAPQPMSLGIGGDGDFTNGEVYEYAASGLAKDMSHTFQFAAGDGTDDATGDTGVHFGPTIQNSPPTAPVVAITPDAPLSSE
jgi:hypothetical protein